MKGMKSLSCSRRNSSSFNGDRDDARRCRLQVSQHGITQSIL